MHDTRELAEARLARFVRDQLSPAAYRGRVPLEVRAWTAPGEPVAPGEAIAHEYRPFAVGDAWGAPWSTTWLRLTGTVPPEWRGPDGTAGPGLRVEAIVDLGFDLGHPGFQAEGLAFTPDGVPIKGISPYNAHVPITAGPGEPVLFYVEAAGNPDVADGFSFRPTPLGDLATAGSDPMYRLRRAELALLDLDVWELVQDVRTLDGLMHELPVDRPRRAEIRHALERMLDVVDPDDVANTAAAGRAELRKVLAQPAQASAHRLFAVGHAHIDSAWLWPTRETVRKCARTFASALQLMDERPDFVFACSSAQQLSWIKEHYPRLFARIREQAAAGRFVPVGGMWVESDTNLPGGEALARQFVHGQRFFAEEFGVDCPEAWLPDSFGYSAALPGIVAAAGIRWFLTQKISWNTTNRMPHHTFWWEGIDGSRLFTHFPPVDKYNSDLSAADLAHAEVNFAEHGSATVSLVPYGWGDGGGGPTREMVAAAERAADLDGSPRVRLSGPREFFAAAEAEYPDAPTWLGELYLEFHRGTYTSQARTKQGNRRSEHLLREAELWAATAAVRLGEPYPYDDLERIWRLVLLQQFHDILPGTSIAWVHREAERNYASIAVELEAMIERSTSALAGDGARELLFNAAPHPRDGVPALAAAPAADPVAAAPVTLTPAGAGHVLQNDCLRARVDERGLLVELHDLVHDRRVLPTGAVGNLLQVHRDLPNEWDAWDIDEHYRRTAVDLLDGEVEVVSASTAAATLRVTRRYRDSTITQDLTLHRTSAALEITTTIDWHERQKLLKLAFPLDVHSERAAAEIQFGHVYRPTHTNTSWDAAKFEVCAHRWVHVGEPGYGVAIVNDSTYGHDILRSPGSDGAPMTTVRLSLLRAPRYPDPEADQGRHILRVALHAGAEITDAVQAGYRLNLPARTVRGEHDVAPLVRVSNPGVVVEAVKLAEDRSGDVIVRLYEALGGRASARVEAEFEASRSYATDLLERPVDSGVVTASGPRHVDLALRPFQIVTLRFARPETDPPAVRTA